MSRSCAPSAALLRTYLKPSTLSRCTAQLRQSSTYMPRHKYAAVTRLDKLHRTQKAALRQEKFLAIQRADSISAAMTPQPQTTTTTTYPFTVQRTPSSQLPVYETAKNGGNRHITTIRKLKGDLDNLASQLRTVLNLPEFVVDRRGNKKANVAINRLNGHVVVRGWRGEEVKAWMTAIGF